MFKETQQVFFCEGWQRPGCQDATTYDYDGLGRRIRRTDPDGNQSILGYDSSDRVVRRQQIQDNPAGPDITVTTDYRYDALGRLHKEIRKPDLVDAGTWQTTLYQYNALDRITSRTKPNGTEITYDYSDNAWGLPSQQIADDGGIEQKTQYQYDRLGRRNSIKAYADGQTTAQTTEYELDGLGRVTKITYLPG